MDTMTYVVVAGWVLMYFIPSFSFAFLTATVLAFLAAFLVHVAELKGSALSLSGVMDAMMPVAPVAFFAIFMAWPLGALIRRIRDWWQGKAAGV
ncbi:MAG: hypothetical protein QNJ13_09605 [Paracoccaceae bacterium]|nr:hypothetical protein [Paracoccaceae bacterium]